MPPNWLLLNAARNQLLSKLGDYNRLIVQKKLRASNFAFQWKGIYIFKRNDRIVWNIKRLVEQQQSAWTSKHLYCFCKRFQRGHRITSLPHNTTTSSCCRQVRTRDNWTSATHPSSFLLYTHTYMGPGPLTDRKEIIEESNKTRKRSKRVLPCYTNPKHRTTAGTP